MMVDSPATEFAERQWYIVRRWQEFVGEARSNLLRVIAVGAFYIVHSVNYYFFLAPDHRDLQFHKAATALAVVWTLIALAVHLALQRHLLPAWLKYLSSAADVVLLTGLIVIGNGAASPLVFAYFLIVAGSAIRFDLVLVRSVTVASMISYLVVLAARDPDWFGNPQRPIEVPRIEQLLFLLSLGITGVIIGQVVRRAKALAWEYARRIGSAGKTDA